jgi:hypothetical protein
VASLAALGLPSRANAQIIESVGVRAQGLGGAFVALADDATASWWNPAGLNAGGLFSGILEATQLQTGDPASRGFALSIPSLALSYYRLPISGIRPVGGSTGPTSPGRKDVGDLSLFGVTVGQSTGDRLVVASTLKLVRGIGDTQGDVDLGVIGRAGHVRLGLVARNLTRPSFGSGPDRVELERQFRVGAAWVSDTGGPGGVSLTLDADLTKTGTVAGDARHVAAGAELWAANRRAAVRGGVAVNTVGDPRASGSIGVSLAVRRGTYVDGQITRGGDGARRGWGLGLRVAY